MRRRCVALAYRTPYPFIRRYTTFFVRHNTYFCYLVVPSWTFKVLSVPSLTSNISGGLCVFGVQGMLSEPSTVLKSLPSWPYEVILSSNSCIVFKTLLLHEHAP